MRFPYLEVPNNAHKFVEQKMTATAEKIAAQAEPVGVEEAAPVIEVAPPKKPLSKPISAGQATATPNARLQRVTGCN